MSGPAGGETRADDLTWREQEVLILLGEHLSNREIADRLHLAESTVKDYVGKILSKLYVKNRREAVKRAEELGLLQDDLSAGRKRVVRLPAERTPFVGRKRELEEIHNLLLETRLLTLTGPGGIGKSRLAVKAAQQAADQYSDGVFFIPLAPITSPSNIVQTTADGLKFPFATHEDPQHQLLRYLRKKQLLLVMDNFEHLLEGAGILNDILEAAPEVKILVTSREKLNLQGETTLIVAGMGTPGQIEPDHLDKNDALTLFIQSARKVQPGFNPSPEEIIQIDDICQTVVGMPLGIELAAAWLELLTVDEINQELKQGYDILAADMRDAPTRHRSLRAVFDHSWALLNVDERRIFKNLSVFRGGFNRHSAMRVAGASLVALKGLVNKSFLSHDPDSGRLEVHELLRQYAQERLEINHQEYQSVLHAHAVYFAKFMQERWELLKGARQMQALSELETDLENVRASWKFFLDQKNASQLNFFLDGFFLICWIRGWNLYAMRLFAEAGEILEKEVDEDAIILSAKAKAYKSYFMGWLNLAEQGYELAGESIKILKDYNKPWAVTFSYYSRALNAYFLGLFLENFEALNNLVEQAAITGDKWLISFSYYGASLYRLLSKDFNEARDLAKLNIALCEEIGDRIGSSLPMITLGHAALAEGELESARDYYFRCFEIAFQSGFHYALQTSSKYLSKVTITMGELEKAQEYLIYCLTITKEAGFVRDVVNLLFEYARLQAAYDNYEWAAELLGLVIAHPASLESRMLEGPIRDSARELLSQIGNKLSPGDLEAEVARGQALDLDEVVDEILAADRDRV